MSTEPGVAQTAFRNPRRPAGKRKICEADCSSCGVSDGIPRKGTLRLGNTSAPTHTTDARNATISRMCLSDSERNHAWLWGPDTDAIEAAEFQSGVRSRAADCRSSRNCKALRSSPRAKAIGSLRWQLQVLSCCSCATFVRGMINFLEPEVNCPFSSSEAVYKDRERSSISPPSGRTWRQALADTCFYIEIVGPIVNHAK